MAPPNLALLMAAGVAGAIVIDYGVKNVRPAFASSSSSSSSVTAGAALTGTGHATTPLPNVIHWERTDQGVDASAEPHSPVQAVVSGVVSAIIPNWFSGQPFVVVDSPGLPGGATGIYYAEQLNPTVKVGDHVMAGQQIGTVAATGTGLEIGFAKGTETLARATSGYIEGEVTHAGELMRQFLKDAGATGL